MSDRTVIYAGTRNLYHDMTVCAKSLLYHDGADRIVFMIEDDTFPEDLPPCITTMNVSGQTFFPRSGPNFTCRWTYMSLLRVALTKLFPDLDHCITLDCDTLVNKPIDYLWDLDLTNYYYAMVEETSITHREHPYFNFGVAVHNLAKLRDGTDDTIIRTLNSVWLAYPEQDAVNSVCRRHILSLPLEYNAMWFNKPQTPDGDEYIKHYANTAEKFSLKPGYDTYDTMTWKEVTQHEKSRRLHGR